MIFHGLQLKIDLLLWGKILLCSLMVLALLTKQRGVLQEKIWMYSHVLLMALTVMLMLLRLKEIYLSFKEDIVKVQKRLKNQQSTLFILTKMVRYGLVVEMMLLNALMVLVMILRETSEPLILSKEKSLLGQEMEPLQLLMEKVENKLCTHTQMAKYGDFHMLETENTS